MLEHDVTADEFLAFVHDIDRSSLQPNHALAAAIAALPGRRLILTNGSREHALRTAEQLGLGDMFEDIFDIVAADLVPKPAAETYQRFFERHDVDPRRSAIFEDIAHNLAVPHARGMVTTLVVPRQGQLDFRDPWESDRRRRAACRLRDRRSRRIFANDPSAAAGVIAGRAHPGQDAGGRLAMMLTPFNVITTSPA